MQQSKMTSNSLNPQPFATELLSLDASEEQIQEHFKWANRMVKVAELIELVNDFTINYNKKKFSSIL
jgi:hypothetical protein